MILWYAWWKEKTSEMPFARVLPGKNTTSSHLHTLYLGECMSVQARNVTGLKPGVALSEAGIQVS